MIQLLAQSEQDFFAALGAIILVIGLIALAVGVLYGVSLMKVFTKAGEEGWKAWVPVYSAMTRAEISGRPSWWGLHILLPIVLSGVEYVGPVASLVSFVINIIISIDTAKSFGKGAGFGVGIGLLGFIFMPILAFGDSRYVGPAGPEGRPGYPAAGAVAYGQQGFQGGYQAPQQWGQQPADQWGQQPQQPQWGQQPQQPAQQWPQQPQQPQQDWGQTPQQPAQWPQQPQQPQQDWGQTPQQPAQWPQQPQQPSGDQDYPPPPVG